MEGLVNYGSDDETEIPINAAERRSSTYRNKYKSTTRRSREASSTSSSERDLKDENGIRSCRNNRHNTKDISKSKESERSAHKIKRDSRERQLDLKQIRDRDRIPERQHRSTRDMDRSERDKQDLSERYNDKSHIKEIKNDRDKQDRRRSEFKEYVHNEKSHYHERNDKYRKESDRHKRHRESDSRSKHRYEAERGGKHEQSSSHVRQDSHRSHQRTSDRKRRYDKSRSNSPAQHTKYNVEHTQKSGKNRELDDTYNGRNSTSQFTSTEATVEKKPNISQTPTNDIMKVLTTNKDDSSQLQLPKYYNPSVVNPSKYAQQIQKRKLLWSGKKVEDNAGKWGTAQFSQDSDGKVASKFMRLMGIKNSSGTSDQPSPNTEVKSREEMFSSMEQQYEVARQATHTMRGVGLGFSSQSRLF